MFRKSLLITIVAFWPFRSYAEGIVLVPRPQPIMNNISRLEEISPREPTLREQNIVRQLRETAAEIQRETSEQNQSRVSNNTEYRPFEEKSLDLVQDHASDIEVPTKESSTNSKKSEKFAPISLEELEHDLREKLRSGELPPNEGAIKKYILEKYGTTAKNLKATSTALGSIFSGIM